MRIRLLGTGSADGWPNPWCGCASCRAALAAGVVRGQSSALVDDRVLLDIGGDGPRAAVRAGVSLDRVQAVLVTHNHVDHHSPQVWPWRSWARGTGSLTLVAPPAVLASAGPSLDPSVTPVPVLAGDEMEVAGYRVRALPARHGGPEVGPAVLYDLTGPDGRRLLWGTDTGALPEPALDLAAGRAYDVVLLELTSAFLPHHLDRVSWPEQVAELRRRGAVTAATRVCAIHLGHDNPPPAELDALLAGWGATAPRDGTVIDLDGSGPAPARPVRVLVLGAARSGKSAYAEGLLAAEPQVTYLATAPDRAGDQEWAERVAAHRERRPAGWVTVETGDVTAALRERDEPLLVDDLGLWLTRQLDEAGGWDDRPGWDDALAAAEDELVTAWVHRQGAAVLVVPEVGAGVVPATAAGRRFRDLLGALTSRLAAGSDQVVQVVAGIPRRLR